MNTPLREIASGGDGAVIWRPGRLWSLWEIMKPFEAAFFLELNKTLVALNRLDIWHDDNEVINEAQKIAYGNALAHFEQPFNEMELICCLDTLKKIHGLITSTNPKAKDLGKLADELQGRLKAEMNGRLFLTMTTNEAKYYNNSRNGWDEVIARFTASVTDIEEASKCFALSRYAAAVFHSLQVIEIGLIDLGRVIVVTDPQTGWNATTNRLKKILATKYPDRTPFQQQHTKFLEQISTTIEALKSAWRNKISHAQDKLVLLTSDFTPDVAEEILFTSRSFMRRLATDAPISPDPDA